MRSFDDPLSLTPDERLSETAAILAGGVLRLCARAVLSSDDRSREEPSKSCPTVPEASEETVLSADCAKRLSEPQEEEGCYLDVEQVVAALRRMTANELRNQYVAVFGEQTNSRNKDWLVRRITWRMQALAEGDIPERRRRRAAELANGSASPTLGTAGESPAS